MWYCTYRMQTQPLLGGDARRLVVSGSDRYVTVGRCLAMNRRRRMWLLYRRRWRLLLRYARRQHMGQGRITVGVGEHVAGVTGRKVVVDCSQDTAVIEICAQIQHCSCNKNTHAHPSNGPFSGTAQVSRYQEGKTNLDFSEARDSEWQWHQLSHMQVCTLLQTDNYASTPPHHATKRSQLCNGY